MVTLLRISTNVMNPTKIKGKCTPWRKGTASKTTSGTGQYS